MDVGQRLRALRILYGLSQRELAKRSGSTNGTISQIEQNSVSPSIASLKKVLGGFPMSLAEFFTSDLTVHTDVFFAADQLVELAGGKVSLRQVAAGLERRLQLLHERYEPGGDTGAAALAHPGEEAGIIVRGAIEVTVGARTKVLQAGDAYAFLVDLLLVLVFFL
jgi:transcriptional regulator with XRE-family HTH domain